MSQITISLPTKEKKRLSDLALNYGFDLPKFTVFILSRLADNLPSESFADYKNPNELKKSFSRGLNDYYAGRVSEVLGAF